MEVITQENLDDLADIIWWIKGYHAAFEDAHESCDFNKDHIESLRKARVSLKEAMDDNQGDPKKDK